MNNKTYINGQDKKLLRKLIQKELKTIRTLIDIDCELYGYYWNSQRHGLKHRGIILNELYNKLR